MTEPSPSGPQDLQRRQQASLLRIAGRMARIGGWAVELSTGKVYWSEEIFEILGFPTDQVPELEASLQRYVGDSEAIIRAAMEQTAREGTPFDVELEIRDYQGHHLHVRAVGEAERDEAGVICRIIGAFQDISPIKAAERRAFDTGQRLTATLEAMSEAFVLLDTQWRFAYLNQEAEGLLQRGRDDLLGKSMWEEFPATVGSEVESVYRRAVEERRPHFLQTYFAPLDHWFEVWAHPSEEGLALYFRAIDDRKRAEEELRASEERFRLLSKATHDAIWDWDIVRDILWWNDGFESLFGFTRADLDVSVQSWVNLIHPEERATVEATVHEALEGSGDSWSASYRFQRADGSYAHVVDRGHIIRDSSGKPVRMIGGMSDLSDRIAAEERLAEHAALLDEASDAILVRDLEHRVLFWNRGAEVMYGWRADEVLGQSVVPIAYEKPEQFQLGMREVLARGVWEGELVQRHRDGQLLTVFSRWSLRRDREGTPTSVLVIDTDVTARRRLEEQLLRSQRMESLGTLAGGIAHDLNNALAPILMAIGLLREGDVSGEQEEVIDTIEASARRGADMVRQVLTFARGIEGQRVPINSVDLLRDVAKIVNETFLKAVHLELQVPEDLWRIIGDPTQLHQVVLNLCLNARDAMPQGGVLRLSARSERVDASTIAGSTGAHAGPHVMIEVTDNGVGMTPAVLDKVFEPFFTTKPVGEGTGLGLSTARAIVESHGGFMRIYSEPNRGTSVRVFLPADPSAAPSGEHPLATPAPSGQGELILVVDDESGVRSVLQRTLEAYGYRVLSAGGGVEAIALYRQHAPDIALVITDMMMPQMDGPALIAALRELDPQLRIIASSGLGTDTQMHEASGRGASHFLAKPFTARVLLDTVRGALATV